MGKIVSLINLKGGVGKTTTTVALAEFLTFERAENLSKKGSVFVTD